MNRISKILSEEGLVTAAIVYTPDEEKMLSEWKKLADSLKSAFSSAGHPNIKVEAKDGNVGLQMGHKNKKGTAADKQGDVDLALKSDGWKQKRPFSRIGTALYTKGGHTIAVSVNAAYGVSIDFDWSDVPRGKTASSEQDLEKMLNEVGISRTSGSIQGPVR